MRGGGEKATSSPATAPAQHLECVSSNEPSPPVGHLGCPHTGQRAGVPTTLPRPRAPWVAGRENNVYFQAKGDFVPLSKRSIRRDPVGLERRVLVLSERFSLEDQWLKLPVWLRAPLYLGAESRCFAAIESHRRANGNMELVVSAIDTNIWDDLWRLEIDTHDAIGNALILFSLLEARAIDIIASESSINTFSNHFTTQIIFSAAEYIGDEDGSQAERIKKPYPRLRELHDEIIAYLGDQLAFRPDGQPGLKLSHMRSYRKLSDDLRSGGRLVLNRSGDMLSDGAVRLTQRAKEHLVKAIGDGTIEYSPAVDTKDRLIRIMFYGESYPRKHHVQVLASSDANTTMSKLLAMFYGCSFNIVRSNIRYTPPKVAIRHAEAYRGGQVYVDEVQYKTIDVTFEVTNEKGSEMLNLLGDMLNDAHAKDRSAFVIAKKSWG